MGGRLRIGSLLLLAMTASVTCAAIFRQDRGAWPENWPNELEAFRITSRTIGVGTGIQENIYEIPIPDAEAFEKIWPAVLKLRTPGGRLTLSRVGTRPHSGWGDLLSNTTPTVRIYAPSGGYSTNDETDPNTSRDYEKLIADGRALRADGPWPKSIIGPNGELPEYVVAEKGRDNQLTWVAADPRGDQDKAPRGFYHRARIDIELIIDGNTIDLNRTKLPNKLTIIDRRFDGTE